MFDSEKFVADHQGTDVYEIIELAYEQGRKDGHSEQLPPAQPEQGRRQGRDVYGRLKVGQWRFEVTDVKYEDIVDDDITVPHITKASITGFDYKGSWFTEDVVCKSAQPEPLKIDLSGYSKEDWERFRKEWANVPIMAQPNTGKWVSPFGIGCVCDCCGYDAGGESNFCPNCGAKMEVTE